jgi:hypothetical protein
LSVTKWRRSAAASKSQCALTAKGHNRNLKHLMVQQLKANKIAAQTQLQEAHALSHHQHRLVATSREPSDVGLQCPRPTILLPRKAASFAIANDDVPKPSPSPSTTAMSMSVVATDGPISTLAALPTSPSTSQVAHAGGQVRPPRVDEAACKAVLSGGSGCFGLGDKHYGLSESVVKAADTTVPSFVRKCHSEFVADHGLLCQAVPTFEERLTRPRKTCTLLYGSFCRCDIGDKDKYDDVEEVQRYIVRHMRARRAGRMHGQTFLTSDTFYPLLIMKCDSTWMVMLMSRVVFSPFECSWIRCDVSSDDFSNPFIATPLFCTWAGTDNIYPDTMTLQELSKFHSHDKHTWTFALCFEYVVSETVPYVLHVDGVPADGWKSVEGPLPRIAGDAGDDTPEDDEATLVANHVSNMIGLLQPKAPPKPTPAATPTTTPPATQNSRRRPRHAHAIALVVLQCYTFAFSCLLLLVLSLLWVSRSSMHVHGFASFAVCAICVHRLSV